MKKGVLLVFLMINYIIGYGYNWPFDDDDNPLTGLNFTVQKPIIGNFAEYENGEYKKGIDIYAIKGTKVYAVESGNVTINGSSVIVGRFFYENLIDIQVNTGVINEGELIGYVNENNYLHFRESTTNISQSGEGEWINPLREGGLSPYIDNTPPLIKSTSVIRQQSNEIVGETVFGKMDIVVDAFDPACFSANKNNYAIQNGINKIQIDFHDYQDNPIPNSKINYLNGFNEIPLSPVELIYVQNDDNIQIYCATNDPNNEPFDKYWNSRQKKGADYSTDAMFPDEALYPEGVIKIIITVFDFKNNSTSFAFRTDKPLVYAKLTNLKLSNQSDEIHWSLSEKKINAKSYFFSEDTEFSLNPTFNITSLNEPEGEIKIKAEYHFGAQTGNIETTGSYNATDKTITLSNANSLTFSLSSEANAETLEIDWQLKFDNNEDWIDVGFSENRIFEVSINPAIFESSLLEIIELLRNITFGSGRPDSPEDRLYNSDFWVLGYYSGFQAQFWLTLLEGKLPSEGMSDIMNNSNKYSFDCAEFVQISRLLGIQKTYINELGLVQGNNKFDSFINERIAERQNYYPGSPIDRFTIIQSGTPGNEVKVLYSRLNKNDDFAMEDAINFNYSVVSKHQLNQIISNAPIGSRLAVTNLDAPENSAWRNENIIKIGNDKYGANPFSFYDDDFTLSLDEIKLKLALEQDENADQNYINDNLFVSLIEYYVEPPK